MNNPAAMADFSGECWPTRIEEIVLRAALASGEEALSAWRVWREEMELDRIDAGSFRLLPLMYRNLLDLNVEDPLMQKLKGVYRRTWYRNQLLFRDLAGLLRHFREAQLDTMLLKGVPLALLHYKDAGLRPMDDCDVLVPSHQAAAAIDLLDRRGWKPEYWRTDLNIDYLHGTGFVDAPGRRLDLHWHALEECLQPRCDDAFWEGAVPAKLHEEPTRAMNSADQLLHVCVHGLRWNYIPPIRWIADAMVILRSAGNTMDWGRLATQADSCGVSLPVRDGLQYLRDRLGASIPEDVLKRLCRLAPTKAERRSYEITKRKPNPGRRLLFHWYNHQRLKPRNPSVRDPEGFLTYLRKRWGLRSAWELPSYLVTESVHIFRAKKRRRAFLHLKL